MPDTEADRDAHALTWEEVHRDARALARAVIGRGPRDGAWAGVVALSRGGLTPACVVARELGLRLVDTLCIASYDETRQGAISVLKAPEAAVAAKGAGWLVVDDLIDTGATAREVRHLLPEAQMAALYVKPATRGLADFYVTEVAEGPWIHFPWDTDAEGQYAPPLVGDG